jgi:hypothetical protein
MISRLASPSVCVIDDEEAEYRAILDALWNLGLACLHVRGADSATLPRQPFKGLRVVFADLHLAPPTGKGAAAHTANIFIKIVSPDTAPVVVVIWSKYASDKVAEEGLPPEDQLTEADCFKNQLLEAEPRFKDRLIFLEMKKPMPGDRPVKKKWVKVLQKEIQSKFKELPAFDVLWSWESLVRNAGIAVSGELMTIASSITDNGEAGLSKQIHGNLKLLLRCLVKEHGGSDCSAATAPRYLATMLAQCLTDQLEHSDNLDTLSRHGKWLGDIEKIPQATVFAPRINRLLHTAAHSSGSRPFIPGTIYRLSDPGRFKKLFGNSEEEFIDSCYQKNNAGKSKTVLVEISPVCDVAQNARRNALLIAGIISPIADLKNIKNSGAYMMMPKFKLQWPMEDFNEDIVFLTFCSRYKLTWIQKKEPKWLRPWFRLRELPTASLRNWHSSNASRVGFVSLG